MSGSQDRTEAATPRRLERARSAGNVAVSRELGTLAGLAGAALVIALAGPALGRALADRLAAMLAGSVQAADVPAAVYATLFAVTMAAGPVVLAAIGASVAATLLQTGLVLNPAALTPDFSRLNPGRGLKRLFGASQAVETLKSVGKLAVLAFCAYHAVSSSVPMLRGAALWLPDQLASHILHQVTQLVLTLLGAQAVIAGADIAWQRYHRAQSLRMSKEDVRQETKEAEGNPQIKQRIRQIRTARSRKRMMAAVPKATVVVTNPTHYAIALSYDRSAGGAPRVVAKGMDDVAARIRDIARDNRVPIVANPPLARALYQVELDAEIPAEHFKIVAGIIAYVWRLSARRPA